METLFETSLAFTRWLQENYPGLESFMLFISTVGRFEFYMALVLFIYWGVDKRQGKRLAYLMALTNVGVNGLKHLLHQPRPFWVEVALQRGETEGYGVPSGHVTIATVTYLYLASWIRRQWVWLTAVVIILLMILSRVYLGQHFLHDVAAGLLLGLSLLFGYWLWRSYADSEFRELILGQRFWITVGVPFLIAFVYGLALYLLGEPDTAVPWADFLTATELFSLEDMTAALAILLGLGMGFVLEGSRIRYLVEAERWQKGVRYLLGMGVTFALLYGLRAAFAAVAPETAALWILLSLRFIRYFAVAIFASFYAPLLFIKIGLATAAPEPPIDVSIRRFKSDTAA